jgi:hypothetical protein
MSFISIFKQTHYSFDDKKPYETVKVLLYRHWVVLLLKIIFFAIMAIMPLVLYILIESFLVKANAIGLFWFLASIYYLVWWYGLFYAITMYLLDIWIVTDHRIIDSQQFGFFKRSVAELNLSKIQDITVAISGPLATFFDYGNLEIQTAGAENRFLFEQIPHPKIVKDLIMQAHYDYMESHHDGTEPHDDSL